MADATASDNINISSLNIQKFDGKNFRQWKFQMKCALRAKGIFEQITGEIPVPNTGDVDYEKWSKRDAVAMCVLTTTMEYEQIALIENCETAKEIMDKLNTIYEQKSELNKLMLHEKFYNYKMTAGESVSSHISKVETLARQLRESGENVSDAAVMTKILGSLPSKFRTLRQAWLSMDESKQTINNLTARLLDEEASLEAYEEQEVALSVSKPGTSKDEKSENKPYKNKWKPICYNCRKRGHLVRDCRANKQDENELDGNISAFTSSDSSSYDDDDWIMDSGASAHMTYRKDIFAELEDVNDDLKVKLGNNSELSVRGKGTVAIKKFVNGQWYDSTICEVLYVPELRRNLFSEGVITTKGMKIIKENSGAKIFEGGRLVACAERKINNLYRLCFKNVIQQQLNVTSVNSLELWHQRLGHINVRSVRDILSKTNCTFSDEKDFFCEACAYGKQHRLSFASNGTKSDKPGSVVYSDVCGPMSVNSIQDNRYFVLFKDSYSGYRVVFFIKNKSDVLDCFKEYCRRVLNKFGYCVKVLHTDNGTEYKNGPFKQFLKGNGIEFETTAPYTPEQNGRAERDMRTIVESARSMIYAKNLPLFLWAEAVNCAVYILNRTPTTQTPNSTPYERWSGKKSQLDHIKVFGSEAYMHIPDQLRSKLNAKSKKLLLVGYDGNSSNYRLFDPVTKKIKVSRNVIFNESTIPEINKNVTAVQIESFDTQAEVVQETVSEPEQESNSDGSATSEVKCQHQSEYNLRQRNEIKMPNRYRNGYELFLTELQVPETYEEAVTSIEAVQWKHAIQEELTALVQNETWEITSLPPGKKAINCKWVFKIKILADSNSQKFKARLCAKGCAQKYGIDYTETFAPTARYDSVRVLLATAVKRQYKMLQFDVTTAFLYGDLEEELYMKPPAGLEIEPNMYCRLKKSLYGLKQSPRCWHTKLNRFLIELGFVQGEADKCVYKGTFHNDTVLLILYVDDGLIMCQKNEIIQEILENIQNQFKITVNLPTTFVGIQINTNQDGSLLIHQKGYIENIIKSYDMTNANALSVPSDPHCHLEASNEEVDDKIPYRSAVGSLMFAAITTRPDIAYAVGVVSRYLNKYNKTHWNAVKRIIRYLKDTKGFGIRYCPNAKTELIGYSDADYAGDIGTRRSTTGYLFMLNSGPVTWTSQLQRTVSLSTTEAEYVAASSATREIVWLRQLLSDIGETLTGPTVLNMDNQSAMKLVRNPEFHKKTKHVDIKYHYIREKYCENILNIKYVPTSNQLADILTKALPKLSFVNLRLNIMCDY